MKGYEPSELVGREFLSAYVYEWLQLQLGVRDARDSQKVTEDWVPLANAGIFDAALDTTSPFQLPSYPKIGSSARRH